MSDSTFDQAALIYAYQNIFLQNEHGKEILKDLMRNGNMFESSFDTQPGVIQFQEGKRAMVLYILKTLQVDVESFVTNALLSEEALL